MESCELSIDGLALEVTSLRGELAVSQLFRFEVTAFVHEDAPAPIDMLGSPFELTMGDGVSNTRVIEGRVVEVERVWGTTTGAPYHLVLEPHESMLTVGGDCRVFQEMSTKDVVDDVLERGGVSPAVQWSLIESYEPRVYCVQYRESDWELVERLLADEGISYYYALDGGTELVFFDDSTGASELPGGAVYPFRPSGALEATTDAIVSIERTQRVTTEVYTVRDYDFETPSVEVEGQHSAGPAALEVYDWPAKAATGELAARRARNQLQAHWANRDVFEGEASGVRLLPGFIIEVDEHPIASMQKKLFIRSVRFAFDRPHRERSDSSEVGWRCAFEAIDATVPHRPLGPPTTRTVDGPQTGEVVGASGREIHPDDIGRVRVQFYWDRLGARDDTASTWQRVGQFATAGSMVLPRVGWDVVVYHHDADVDAPYVVTHVYDGEHPTPYALPDHKTRTAWQTNTTPGDGTSNEFRFEDAAGSEEIFVNASKDQNVVVGNNLDDNVGVDHTLTVGANSTLEVGSNNKWTIGGDQSVTVGASESLTVSGARNVSVTGSETTTIGGSRTVTAIKGISVDAKGGRSLTVGGSMIGAASMGVSRSTLGLASISIGAADISAAASGVSNVTLGACAETIGGAKIEAAGSSHDRTGKGAMALTVGGANIIAAGANIGETSGGSLKVLVGGAFVGNAPTISIEADSKIVVQAGGASLTIKSSSVEIKAPTIALPSPSVDTCGSTVDHN